MGGVDPLGLAYLALLLVVAFLPMLLRRRGSPPESNDSDSMGAAAHLDCRLAPPLRLTAFRYPTPSRRERDSGITVGWPIATPLVHAGQAARIPSQCGDHEPPESSIHALFSGPGACPAPPADPLIA